MNTAPNNLPSDSAPPGLILSRAEIREIERQAIEIFGIPGIVLMENAARGVTDEVLARLKSPWSARRVGIACGVGNNGGDGWAVARHLSNTGVDVVITALGAAPPGSDAAPPGSDAAVNASIVRRMKLPEVAPGTDWGEVDLVVDALFGTGLNRPIEGVAARLVARLNAGPPIVSVDIPSGLDADRGEPLGPVIKAAVTVTFVALKPGFLQPAAQSCLGEVKVVEIGIPRGLITIKPA